MSFKGTIIVLVLFVFGVLFSGFASYSNHILHPKQDANIDAAKLVSQNCASCHGQDLTGKIGPNLHQRGSVMSEAEIEAVIKDGINAKPVAMPSDPGKMNDQQITAVAQYIESLK